MKMKMIMSMMTIELRWSENSEILILVWSSIKRKINKNIFIQI